MKVLKRFLLLLLSASLFILVITQIEPPNSWNEASTFQILIFFLPILLIFTFLANLFLHKAWVSFLVGLLGLLLLVLKTASVLNTLTVVILVAIFATLGFFIRKYSLTKHNRVPKLSGLRKQNKDG